VTRVILAAGHGLLPSGKPDPGTTYKALVEHKLNEQAMWAAYDELRRRNVDVKLERGSTRNTEDHKDGNWTRFRADLQSVTDVRVAVEIHHDYYKASRGGFGIYPKAVGYSSKREQAVCAAITAAYAAAGLPVKASYGDVRGLGLLRRPKFPTLIWECDRLGDVMTAPADAGRAIAAGILWWLTS